jgi:hypothetical protein
VRAAIFIDGGYLLSQMKKNDITPKYDELANYLLKPLRKTVQLDLLRCYFYYCAPMDVNRTYRSRKKTHGRA